MKRKLLLTMLCIVSALGMRAQKDVTDTYITNATLSSLTGWTVSNFNTPVKGNNTVGYASESYAGWDALSTTSFSLTQNITLPAGNYTLVSYSFFRQGQNYNTDASKSLAFLKAGANQVAIKTLGSITAPGYANSQAEGANAFDSKMYRNTLDFTIDADNTTIEIGLYGTFDEKRSWCIAGQFELIDKDKEATMEAPFNVTGYITNPGFEYRDMTGWTLSSGAFETQSNNQSFKVGGYYAQKWQSSSSGALTERSMSQTLTELPAGYYKLTANLGGNGTYIDINGRRASWTADKDYTVGYVLSANEDLVITAGKTAEGTANWIHFDNFRLYFCGDVQAALTALLNKLSSYDGKIPSAAYSALSTSVAPYAKEYSDIDELLAAIDAVQALYNDADLLVTPYSNWKTVKSTAETYAFAPISTIKTSQNTLVENATTADVINAGTTELSTAISNYDDYVNMDAAADAIAAVDYKELTAGSHTTFTTVITAQAAAVPEATTAKAIATATSTLKTAISTYIGAADPTEGNQFDITCLLTNPDLTGLPTWTKAEGWHTDMEGGNSQVMTNDGVKGDNGNAFYEYWSEVAAAEGKFTLYQKLTLPVGTFTINCDAFASANDVVGADESKVYFYANETQGSLVSAQKLTASEIAFINESEQEVKIGLKALEGNEYRWMGIGYVKLYKDYTDNTTYAINCPAFENGSVTIFVDDEEATEAKALKTVTLACAPNEDCAIYTISATYNDGEQHSLDVAKSATNVYTFQMPAYDVNVTITAVAYPSVTIGSTGYATFASDYPLDFTGLEVEAYYASGTADNGNIAMTKIAGTVAAGTGMILKADAGDYKIPVVAFGTSGTSYAGNLLARGTGEEVTSGYVFGVGKTSGDVAFYPIGSKHPTIDTDKAYLNVTPGAGILNIVFDEEGEATGIATPEVAAKEDGVIYNLNGQIVTEDYKGIVIKNGKKYFNK